MKVRIAAWMLMVSCILFSTHSFSEPYYEESYDQAYDDNGGDYYYGDENYDNYDEPYYDSAPKTKKSRHKQIEQAEDYPSSTGRGDYESRLPQQISTNEKTIIVDPHVHAWGAYEDGRLIHAGLATAGSNWCKDLRRPCRTKVGVFRINSLGNSDCISSKYPLGEGGAPMPYCMYFNGNQGLHGSEHIAEGNLSHGCVRMSVDDAEWIRFNFARVGTKVIVKPY